MGVRILAALAAFLLLGAAQAQTAAEVQQALDGSVKGKPLLIRGFVADKVVRYAWKGDRLEHAPTQFYTLGLFVADSVKVHQSHGVADEVRIQGRRWTLVKTDPAAVDALSKGEVKVTFDVDLRGADKAAIDGLAGTLFFPDVDAALRAVPPQFVRAIGLKKPGVNMNGGWKPGSWVNLGGKWQVVQGRVAGPRVVYSPEPEFSEEARLKKIGGAVLIAMTTCPDGSVEAVWLLRPLGYGLDEKAMQTGVRYRFDPQQWEGQAVGGTLNVSVNFQIF